MQDANYCRKLNCESKMWGKAELECGVESRIRLRLAAAARWEDFSLWNRPCHVPLNVICSYSLVPDERQAFESNHHHPSQYVVSISTAGKLDFILCSLRSIANVAHRLSGKIRWED